MLLTGKKIPRHILVNRIDAMGDVILALPLCGLIKKYYPDCRITFFGRTYTKSIAMASIHVDSFLNRDDWNGLTDTQITASLQQNNYDMVIHLLPAKEVIKSCWKAKIRIRIGGMNKIDYWLYCNRIVPFSRKKSRLNEAQLNVKLLSALGIEEFPALNELHQYYGFTKIPVADKANSILLATEKFNLVLHPLSNKNAKEWGLHNFAALIRLVDLNKIRLFITGSEKEKEILAEWIEQHKSQVTDLTGKLNTDQLIAFIAASDGLIASSTGPVHIAAATGIHTLGLYENRWIKRGERWGPVGKNAGFIECTNNDMNSITPAMVYDQIKKWL